ncbi:MAG: DUF2382 domain-containing protein [Leptolyngbya sp. DLM2.Bin27]|nr:MAG: DUF2382 domain-containing protein [Leptolyngbya sp. DLM2.Bin27]
MTEHQLVNSSVFDRSGYLIGKVTRVQPLSGGDFSLIVQITAEGLKNTEVTIGNNLIRDIDSKNNILHIYLDHTEFIPPVGKGIQLLEERLVVHRERRKVGEISVRKVVETEIIEVPIKREKLVVEKIGETDPLFEVGLSDTQIRGHEPNFDSGHRLASDSLCASGKLNTIRQAINFLETVANRPDHRCRQVRVTITLAREGTVETTTHCFEFPSTALKALLGLETTPLNHCSQVQLELFLNDDSMLPTYQTWLTQSEQPINHR